MQRRQVPAFPALTLEKQPSGDDRQASQWSSPPGPLASGALKEKFGVLGGSVTLSVETSIQNIDSIVWIFNSTTLAIIKPGVADKKATILMTRSHNEERMIFSGSNYSLTLLQLKKNDSGIYRVEMNFLSSQSSFTQEYGLQVYECLSKPKVTMGLQNNKNGTCVANLTCSMEQGGENVTYSWNVLGQRSNKSYDGSILPISWSLGERDTVFICTARNPISSNSSSPILAWKLCRDADGDGSNFLLTFLCLLLVVFTLCTLVLMFHLTMRIKRRKEPIEGEKRMDVHQEIPNVCPHSGEKTVYETICYAHKINPAEDPLNTLYSTVQIPKMVENPCSPTTTPDTPRLFTYEDVI
ncbi:SLAM family member 7 isoform X1 [Marmota marmota marmota]|uniref:SLAM family member 7 isoform X1 n=1 Tax=Marmota marmota marmota TaxID=9994 RepID=UPI002092A63C|nr:SLAM family member 7 isoform X1 [Marmota marmota marmota]